MKQRPSAAFWASAARVSVRQVWSCAASGSGRSELARKDHAWSRGEGEGEGRGGGEGAEAGAPCQCRRHPSRVAVCISMLPPRCDRLAAWRREGSGVPRTFPQTRTARRQSLEHLHRKRLPQTNRLLPPPYYSAALLMLAPLSGPPLVPATLAIAARPAPSPSPPWQTCARGERRDAGYFTAFIVN